MSNQQQPYVNYNNYPQYYSAQAPPQPAWPTAQGPPAQPPSRTGWVDPRASQQQYGQQTFQAPPPLAPSYNPNQYGLMPGASPAQGHASQHTWGVKYQQQAQQQQYQQQHEPKPALPPRPLSAASRIDTPVTLYQSQIPTQWSGRPNDAQYAGGQTHTPSESWGSHNAQLQSHSDEPPPPPPRPAAYAQALNWPHEHYASKPPSHHYEPSSNPNWKQVFAEQHSHTSASSESGYDSNKASVYQSQAPVSPLDAVSQAPLSHTTTYDYYQPVQTPLQGDPNFPPSQTATALGYGAGPSDWEYFAPESEAVSPEITHSTPADVKPQTNLAEKVPDPLEDQSTGRKISDAQHETSSQGRATPRQESFSDEPQQGLHRTGTIDSVIHAWNAPLQPRKVSLRSPSVGGSPNVQSALPSIVHSQIQTHLQDLRAQTPTPQSSVTLASDPYSDLEPQHRASLAHFVAMLRKEAAVESDEDKFKVFENFVQKERRLRAVLYDIDLTPVTTDLSLRTSPQQHDKAPPVTEAKAKAMRQKSEDFNGSDNAMSVFEPEQPPELSTTTATPAERSPRKVNKSPKSKDESFVMVEKEQSDDSAYSPGGRPLVQRPTALNTRVDIVTTPAANPTIDPLQSSSMPSPSDNAPQVVSEDYASTVLESPALAAPIVLAPRKEATSPGLALAATSNGPLSMPMKFEPPRPVYTPFKYAEGPQPETLALQRPPDQDYLAKRNTYDSGRLMHEGPLGTSAKESLTSPTTTKKLQEETFLGLIRSHSTARPKSMIPPESIRPRTSPLSAQLRGDPIEDAVQALRALLPPALPAKSQPDKALEIRQRMEAFVDDFSFIRGAVIPWDRDNREIRKRLDEERHKRTEESETRLDELFNDNEIAYAELKGMEADFKLAEAERRYEEDKQELDSFSRNVYLVVTEKLQQQVDVLSKEYILAIDLLDLESDPAARLLNGNGNRSAMSDAMDIVLQIFEKLNIRYLKLAEARFERERRRKRLELTVLYTNGDAAGTRKLEKEFSTAEKLQVLQEERDRDQRARRLMESFDRATIRGLGDNQAFLDEVFAKVRKLNDVLPAKGLWQQSAGGSVYGENGARKALASAQAIVDLVLADSRALLTTTNRADKTLNDADYAVSVAEARAADADERSHSKLKADKENEDAKLFEEHSTRMDSINKTPFNCVMLIQEIVARVGDDEEHPDRMKKALEQAKMRNAGKET